MKLWALIVVSLSVGGCASAPPVSELRNGISRVAFVQEGSEPLRYAFGVVDTTSFWAAYGDGVAAQTGGGTLWTSLASSGRSVGEPKAPDNATIMRALYNKHPLHARIRDAVMPQLAQLWGTQYRASELKTIPSNKFTPNPDTKQVEIDSDADLVLTYAVSDITLTERFSMGGALAAGFTLGMNTKSVTTVAQVRLTAYRRDNASKRYSRVWGALCGTNYTEMKTSFPFPEVVKNPGKAQQLLDETTDFSIKNCSSMISAHAKN